MKKILLATLCFASIGVFAQYEEERFPQSAEEISFTKKNKIASMVIVDSTDGRGKMTIKHFDKNGLLLYSSSKKFSETNAHYKYDKKGRLKETIDSSYDAMFKKWWSNTYSYDYYKNGLLKERILNGSETTFEFDEKQNKLTELRPEEVADGSTCEYFYNAGQQLIKTIRIRASGDEYNEYKEYDQQGHLLKMVATTKYLGSTDSLNKTYTYNSNGDQLTEKWVKTLRSAPLNDEGEPDESGQWEETVTRRNWVYEYDEKGRQIKSVLTSGDDNIIVVSSQHTFTLENGIVTEHVVTTDGKTPITEETIVYNAPNGLKGISIRKEVFNEKQTTTTTTYTYTFH